MASEDKTVTYRGKVIDDAVMVDFYTRLNDLRTWAGVSNLAIPTFAGTKITAAQVKTDLQNAITSTKSAVSFLTSFTLIYGAPDATAGNKIHAGVFQNAAGTTVARAEKNIGDLEGVCRAYKAANWTSQNSSNWTTNFSSHACSTRNASDWSTNNSSHACSSQNSSNWTTNGSTCSGFNSSNWTTNKSSHACSTRNASNWTDWLNSPFFNANQGGFQYWVDFSAWTFYCPAHQGFSGQNSSNWTTNCGSNACSSRNVPFWSTNHSSHACSTRNASFWSTNNSTHACSSQNSSNWTTNKSSHACSTRNVSNFNSFTLTFTAHKNTFKVEGIDMA